MEYKDNVQTESEENNSCKNCKLRQVTHRTNWHGIFSILLAFVGFYKFWPASIFGIIFALFGITEDSSSKDSAVIGLFLNIACIVIVCIRIAAELGFIIYSLK